MKQSPEIKEENTKKLLSNNLMKISSKDFNEEIIQQLNLSNKKEKINLFDQNSMIKIFLMISFLILGINLNIVEKLTQTEIIIGTLICTIPIYFILFNKIYQFQNSQK